MHRTIFIKFKKDNNMRHLCAHIFSMLILIYIKERIKETQTI